MASRESPAQELATCPSALLAKSSTQGLRHSACPSQTSLVGTYLGYTERRALIRAMAEAGVGSGSVRTAGTSPRGPLPAASCIAKQERAQVSGCTTHKTACSPLASLERCWALRALLEPAVEPRDLMS
jgi:hypothetical protein